MCHIQKQQSHQVHHGPFTAAVMVTNQVSGASELAPSELKRSTTSRQFSSVMSQHMVYSIASVVQAAQPFRFSKGSVLIVYESLNNAIVTAVN